MISSPCPFKYSVEVGVGEVKNAFSCQILLFCFLQQSFIEVLLQSFRGTRSSQGLKHPN